MANNNVKKNGFWDSNMRAGVTAAIVSVIVSAVISIGISYYFVYQNDKKIINKNAKILYSDLKFSLRNVTIELKDINIQAYNEYLRGTYIIKRDEHEVTLKFVPQIINKAISRTPMSNLIDNYFNFLPELKDAISNKDYQNITTFYDNLSTVEKMRIDYLNQMNTNPDKNRDKFFLNYYMALIQVHMSYLYNKGIHDSIENVGKLSGMEPIDISKFAPALSVSDK